MFDGATAFKQNISNWTPYACTSMISMFSGIDINVPDSNTNQDNYNALLNSWGTYPKLPNMQPNVIFNGGNSQYSGSDAVTSRSNLTTNGWTITDGGQNSPVSISLQFSYNYTGIIPITESIVIANLPVITLTGVFEITPVIDISNLPLVSVTINATFNESPSYPSDFGFTFNIPNIVSFYNTNTNNLIFISSTNFPFSQ